MSDLENEFLSSKVDVINATDKVGWKKDDEKEEPANIDPGNKNVLLFKYQVAVVQALQDYVSSMDADRGPVIVLKSIQDAVNETTRVISWLYGQREDVPVKETPIKDSSADFEG